MRGSELVRKFIVRNIYRIIIILIALIQVYPLVWIITASFRDGAELSLEPFSFPKSITLENYIRVIEAGNVLLLLCSAPWLLLQWQS